MGIARSIESIGVCSLGIVAIVSDVKGMAWWVAWLNAVVTLPGMSQRLTPLGGERMMPGPEG